MKKTYSTATITKRKVKNGIIYNDDLEETKREVKKFIKKHRKGFEHLAKA